MVTGRDHTAWGARVLAPLAFFAAATVLVLLVQSSLNAGTSGEDGNDTDAAAVDDNGAAAGRGQAEGDEGQDAEQDGQQAEPGEQAQEGEQGQQQQQQRRRYRIRPGDTLESIAARFDTTVDDLLALNPGIDPTSLTPGQRIRIR